jgi:hypothetical protein
MFPALFEHAEAAWRYLFLGAERTWLASGAASRSLASTFCANNGASIKHKYLKSSFLPCPGKPAA